MTGKVIALHEVSYVDSQDTDPNDRVKAGRSTGMGTSAQVTAQLRDQPFPRRDYTPRLKLPGPDYASRGTLDEKRRGPFPIGVAVETTVPAEWYSDKAAEPATVRVAAIGHGGLFTGKELSPGKERLLLDTCNWLLGRDHQLPKQGVEWKFQRNPMDTREQFLWYGGALLGLPGLFAYLGLVVLLVRRLR